MAAEGRLNILSTRVLRCSPDWAQRASATIRFTITWQHTSTLFLPKPKTPACNSSPQKPTTPPTQTHGAHAG